MSTQPHGFGERVTEGEIQVAGKSLHELILCYLACPQDAGKRFLGAILLTDYRARPLHFAYVAPIQPTLMQRILYGPTLNEHLKIDVIAAKLWQGLPKRPDVMFVEAHELLNAGRIAQVPAAYLERNPDTENDSAALSTLVFDTGPNTPDRGAMAQVVGSLESSIDLLEPFSRMRQALIEAVKAGALQE